jgi:hypothetical protein
MYLEIRWERQFEPTNVADKLDLARCTRRIHEGFAEVQLSRRVEQGVLAFLEFSYLLPAATCSDAAHAVEVAPVASSLDHPFKSY